MVINNETKNVDATSFLSRDRQRIDDVVYSQAGRQMALWLLLLLMMMMFVRRD